MSEEAHDHDETDINDMDEEQLERVFHAQRKGSLLPTNTFKFGLYLSAHQDQLSHFHTTFVNPEDKKPKVERKKSWTTITEEAKKRALCMMPAREVILENEIHGHAHRVSNKHHKTKAQSLKSILPYFRHYNHHVNDHKDKNKIKLAEDEVIPPEHREAHLESFFKDRHLERKQEVAGRYNAASIIAVAAAHWKKLYHAKRAAAGMIQRNWRKYLYNTIVARAAANAAKAAISAARQARKIAEAAKIAYNNFLLRKLQLKKERRNVDKKRAKKAQVFTDKGKWWKDYRPSEDLNSLFMPGSEAKAAPYSHPATKSNKLLRSLRTGPQQGTTIKFTRITAEKNQANSVRAKRRTKKVCRMSKSESLIYRSVVSSLPQVGSPFDAKMNNAHLLRRNKKTVRANTFSLSVPNLVLETSRPPVITLKGRSANSRQSTADSLPTIPPNALQPGTQMKPVVSSGLHQNTAGGGGGLPPRGGLTFSRQLKA